MDNDEKILSCNQEQLENDLRDMIVTSLEKQGFIIQNGNIFLPEDISKEKIRKMHNEAISCRIERAKKGLKRFESRLLSRLASGVEVVPEKIEPRLHLVLSNTEEELVFRYLSLHWSIPVSSGYGRRLRFLVIDNHTEKVIGLFGLGDPVFSLGARDRWVGWNQEDRRIRLQYVMDAFVLGAVPPYSYLLGGKLVALLVSSNEVQEAFRKKYKNHCTTISGRKQDGRLAMITTTSALGRSSIYNRLKYDDEVIFQSVGYTTGSGDFHFSNGIYGELTGFAKAHCEPSAKKEEWGTGFRNRREVIRKVLAALGLSCHLAYHKIHREIFVVPLAVNTFQFLKGEDKILNTYVRPVDSLFDWYRKRWLLPRVQWDFRYRQFNPESFLLWKKEQT